MKDSVKVAAIVVFGMIAVFAIAGTMYGGTTFITTDDGDDSGTQIQTGVGYSTTVTAGAKHAINKTTLDVNGQIYGGEWVSSETQVNACPTDVDTSAPNTLSGFMMIGNDADQSGTDRGGEIYYRKIPFSYSNKGTYTIKDTDGGLWIDLYPEDTGPTFTFYDDGSSEDTANITIGSGATVTTGELRIQASADEAIGNPAFSNSVALCFNTSDNGKWDEIRPDSYIETVDACDAYNGYNVLGDCYVVSDALVDYESWRDYLVFDAAAGKDPVSTDYAYVWIMDKAWYQNDKDEWVSGFCDDSAEGTDVDPGIDHTSSNSFNKKINFM